MCGPAKLLEKEIIMRCFLFFHLLCALFIGFGAGPVLGAAPVRLNAEPAYNGDVSSDFTICPFIDRVVYIADQDTNGVDELYSVPINGGTPVQLNADMIAGGNVAAYAMGKHYEVPDKDSYRVVYLADQETDGVFELFSVPVTGGTPVKLNAEMVTGGNVTHFWAVEWGANRLVYRADQDTDEVYELFSVPVTGGTPVKLNPELVSGGDVQKFYTVTPTRERVVYLADQEADGVAELFSVPANGGPAVKLNGELPPEGEVFDAALNQYSSRVVYRSDQETEGVAELFSVDIDGGIPVKLSSASVSGGQVLAFSISPDGQRVIYLGDQETKSVWEIFSVPIAGGAVVKLNHELDSFVQVNPDRYNISPDSTRVLYQVYPGHEKLYSVPIAGGRPILLSPRLPPDADVMHTVISPDSSWVVYQTTQDPGPHRDLYSVPITGGTSEKLNSGALGLGIMEDFCITTDSSRVVYRGYQDSVALELYSVSITGGTPLRLNAELAEERKVDGFAVSRDDSRVVYRADQRAGGVHELFSQRLAPELYFPHVGGGSWETEIAVINTHSSRSLTGRLVAYTEEGAPVSEGIMISLVPHGRREIDVDATFSGADYLVLTADAFETGMCGYTKFAIPGRYRVAVPAVATLNYGKISVPHVASTDNWWTGIALLNPTSVTKQGGILCSNGRAIAIDLEPNEHRAFTFAEILGEPQPEIASAEITLEGVVGLELFGHKREMQLSGVLLRDWSEEALYFPHVASDDRWWTGICAYNPGEASTSLDITAYDEEGTVLGTTGETIAPHEKYIGPFSELELDQDSAWFEIQASRPITGFELFASRNGKQLAGYTAVQIRDTRGVFPKLEDDGWTGIAFVNTASKSAVVTLTAYNDAGERIAEEPISLWPKRKKVDHPEAIFHEDISEATYLSYQADRPVVGFQLNGSADGMLLDGLPGM
jgi:Tol biopolymer transport system component